MANGANNSFNQKETNKKFTARLDIVKTGLKSKAGRSKILSILKDNPCQLIWKHLVQYLNQKSSVSRKVRHVPVHKQLTIKEAFGGGILL